MESTEETDIPASNEVTLLTVDGEINGIEEDIKELKGFIDQAKQARVKELLKDDIKELEAEAKASNASVTTAEVLPGVPSEPEAASVSLPQEKRLPTKTLDTYGWDQSDKFVKIYVSMDNSDLKGENVKSEFTGTSFKVRMEDVKGKNYELKVVSLFKNIIPGESYHRVKPNRVTVFLKKEEQKKTWAYITSNEQKLKDIKDANEPKIDDKDPNAGMMQMMQKMYNEGDDEMKRTINKAWSESQDKKSKGMGDFMM